MFFCDESGFNLVPCIPYGWLPIGKQVSLKSSKSKQHNFFGLLSIHSHKIKAFHTQENINGQFILECIEQVIESITNLTVLVLDNASWHVCQLIQDKRQEWEEKGLYLFFLPPYSPHLNPTEIFWRKAKYEWLEPEDFSDNKTLKKALFNIFQQYHREFQIQFSENIFK